MNLDFKKLSSKVFEIAATAFLVILILAITIGWHLFVIIWHLLLGLLMLACLFMLLFGYLDTTILCWFLAMFVIEVGAVVLMGSRK